jgi:hypothetical protein
MLVAFSADALRRRLESIYGYRDARGPLSRSRRTTQSMKLIGVVGTTNRTI